jgi:SAM-dependent methyltransferase
MIDLAREQEQSDRLAIEYRVGDAQSIDYRASLDLVFAAYLLNYASTVDELNAMCQAISRSLKPGGRFVTVNNNPDDPPSNFGAGSGYGYTKRLGGSLVEGTPIVWSFHLPDTTIEVTNYYLKKSTLEAAQNLCDLVPALNITNDPKLEGVRAELERIIGGIGVETIRTDLPAREEIKKEMDDLASRLDF